MSILNIYDIRNDIYNKKKNLIKFISNINYFNYIYNFLIY